MSFGSGRDFEYDPKNPHARGPPVEVRVQRAHTPSSGMTRREKQARRRAAREAESWRDNDDRNDENTQQQLH